MLTGRKLPLTLAFAVLIGLAAGMSCQGFFVNPTIASFVISPTDPTVPLNGTQQMSAYGTDTDGNPTGNITTQISWSSGSGAITIGASTGLLTGVSMTSSPVTITANYEALAAQTTTATVCVESASNLTISPINYVDSNSAATEPYYAYVDTTGNPKLDVSASVQWTTTNTAVSIADGTDPATATITVPTSGSPVAGSITATYSCNGTTLTATTSITVNPS
ncbi:MAG: hypothetical protein ABSD64_10905 [Terriglobales bacterium]|jgi:hypothetical protein